MAVIHTNGADFREVILFAVDTTVPLRLILTYCQVYDKFSPANNNMTENTPPVPPYKRSPQEIKRLNRLVESYKLLMAITALCDTAPGDGGDSKALYTLRVEAHALCMHTITSNRLSSQDQEIAGNTARQHVTLRGYKFRDGTELPVNAFARWIYKDTPTRVAVVRQHVFRDYEKDAMEQLRRLEKRGYLRRVAQNILQDKKVLEKAKTIAAKAAKAQA